MQYAHSRPKPVSPIPKLHSTPLPTPSQPVCNKPAPSEELNFTELTPTGQPASYKPTPSPPLHQPPSKQIQPTQTLDNKNKHKEPEQKEQEQEQQESEFVYTCNGCQKSEERRYIYHYTVCEDVYLCESCYQKKEHIHKKEKLGSQS